MRLVSRLGVSERVVDAYRAVAREHYVPEGWEADAYIDRPIPLPGRQTTSQPTLIAMMIDAAEVTAGDKVLEVGGGYGFQTALLAQLGAEVFSLELDPALADAARVNLKGFENAHVVVGDGWVGLPAEAPFDAIIVAAAAEELPKALAEQLAEGGRMVIPLEGARGDEVWVLRKQDDVVKKERILSPARFVPLVRRPDDRA